MSNHTVWRVDLETTEGTYRTRKQIRATSAVDAERIYADCIQSPPDGYVSISLVFDCRIQRTQSLLPLHTLDIFDAASYPEPTMSDVAGAYEARLAEQFSELGRVTRKLGVEERGYGVTMGEFFGLAPYPER